MRSNAIDRTRPVGAYPQAARWKGTGGSDDAATFVQANAPAPGTPHQSTPSTR